MRAGAVHIYTVATGEHREIGDGHWPVWSPDGQWVAYVFGNIQFVTLGSAFLNVAPSAVYIAPAAAGPSVLVVPRNDGNVSPAWLPDGRLLFVSDRGGGRDIYVVELDDDGTPKSPPARVTTGLNPHTISVSRDGRSLVYSTLLLQQNVRSIDITGGEPVSGYDGDPITTGRQVVEGVAVSPNGQSLAFDSNRSGSQDVYVRALAGGSAVQVTDHPADEFVGDWSPDGEWLTGHTFQNGNRDVFVMRVDGTGFQIVDDAPIHQRYPDWSPDGRSLVFQSNLAEGTSLQVSHSDDGSTWSEPQLLTAGVKARWSPDGTLIAFYRDGDALVVDRAGNQSRVLFEGGVGGVAWSSDGRELLVLDRNPDGTAVLRGVSVSGGPPRTVVLFDDALRSPRSELVLHGDRIYYTYPELEGDIWVMDLIW